MKTIVRLGDGERILMVGHEIVIYAEGGVYCARDFTAACEASYGWDADGDLRRVSGDGSFYGGALRFRVARCPSEQRRFERLFVKNFKDSLRIKTRRWRRGPTR